MTEIFRKYAQYVSQAIGSVRAFLIFIVLLVTTGYYEHFSSRWENTVSFLIAVGTLSVLFFLQKSQNHSDKATHLKLDELIKASKRARNEVISAENEPEEKLEKLSES